MASRVHYHNPKRGRLAGGKYSGRMKYFLSVADLKPAIIIKSCWIINS